MKTLTINLLESVNPETQTDKKTKLERRDSKGFRRQAQTLLEIKKLKTEYNNQLYKLKLKEKIK